MNLSKPFHTTAFDLLSFLGKKFHKSDDFFMLQFSFCQAFVQFREEVVQGFFEIFKKL